MITMDDLDRIAELCALREMGTKHLRPSDIKLLYRFWDENDPHSTITGDDVGKLFPEVLDAWPG